MSSTVTVGSFAMVDSVAPIIRRLAMSSSSSSSSYSCANKRVDSASGAGVADPLTHLKKEKIKSTQGDLAYILNSIEGKRRQR